MTQSLPTAPNVAPDDLDARLDDYRSQAIADLQIAERGSRSGPESSFAASAEALAAPEASAPGFVSFTGGAHPRSAHAGPPRTVVASDAGVYAELDTGLLDHRVEDEARDLERGPRAPDAAASGPAVDPFDLRLPPATDDAAPTLISVPAIGLLALGSSGLGELRRRRRSAAALAAPPAGIHPAGRDRL